MDEVTAILNPLKGNTYTQKNTDLDSFNQCNML